MNKYFLAGSVGSAFGSILTFYLMKKTLGFEQQEQNKEQKVRTSEPTIEVLGSNYGYFSSTILKTLSLGLAGNEGVTKSKVLSNACNGKTKCELNINNTNMLGDPAKYHDKVFKYYYRCNKWSNQENKLIEGDIVVDEVQENQTVIIDCNKKIDLTKYMQKKQ